MAKKRRITPPWIAEKCFHRMFPDGGYYTTICDLQESFNEVVRERGLFFGEIWYRYQVLSALYFFLCLQLRGGLDMFKHHFKITLRNLRRHKSYSFINIFGLAVSFAVVIFIALFIRNELSFDRGNEHIDRMYTVMMGGERGQQHIISAAALELSENVPELVKYTRLSLRSSYALQYHDTKTGQDRNIMIKGLTFAWVDPGMFEVFTYDFKAGNPEVVLDEPYSIVLTEEVARGLFGNVDPIAKVVTLNSRHQLTVTGVVKKPTNSHLNLNAFASILTLRSISGPDADRGYVYNSEPTYVLLSEEHDLEAVNQKIDIHMAGVFKRVGRSVQEFSLFPVSALYLSNIRFRGNHGSKTLLWILFTIAIFIVVIAGINFVNLSTARASTRAREIGIKKVIGVLRKNLTRQFLGESMFVSLTSLGLALSLAVLFFPAFNRAFDVGLNIGSLFEPVLLFCLVAGACIIGIISGLYPAFYLSAFQPVTVIRGDVTQGRKGSFFRKALIVFQFAVSVMLIIGTLTITNQIRFARNKDLGFSAKNVITFPQPRSESFRRRLENIKTELLRHPDILEVSFSHGYPGRPSNNEGLKIGDDFIGFTHYSVDSDFADVYGLQLLEGRFLDLNRKSDHLRAVVINETAVREFGLESPVGIHLPFITRGNLTAFPVEEIEIVGVVKDFHCRSLHQEINPILISYNREWMSSGGILYSGEDLAGVVSYAKEVWKRFAPGFPFEFSFLDQEFREMYAKDAVFEQVFFYAAGFSILIACLGLLGLASYVAAKRTKEIGIRKVLGASLSQILILFSTEFVAAIILANLIAWPAAYYFMKKWLANFAYRIDLGIGIFAISAFLALAVALITIGWQSVKAAITDPVNSLRYE
ncbi:MAG: ABC transporter permease [Candidatus Aminicenantes bacterium]|nr:MAG: ABC transporter permease [Candidatus Aminicenantes bacterium]